MTQTNYSTKHIKNKHLTIKERAQIELLIKQGTKKSEIARIIGISRSTLYNELNRGTVEQMDTHLKIHKEYFAETGQAIYEQNRKNSCNPYKFIKAFDFIKYSEKEILEKKYSPDVVCGLAKKEGRFNEMVSTKTLYNYIDAGLMKVKNIDLTLKVKMSNKSRRRRKNRRIMGESIEKRPQKVNERNEFGHWEIDTVVGTKKRSAVLLTLAERVTRQLITVKIPSRSSQAVSEAMKKIISQFGDKADKIFKSITADNGSEFATLTDTISFADVYFTHPYSSFERGTNEKQNSLLRRFFPKNKSLENISYQAIKAAQDWINTFPRKIFDYYCSNDLFLRFVNSF